MYHGYTDSQAVEEIEDTIMPSIQVSGFVPKELINVDAVRLELLNAFRAEGRMIRKELRQTVRTWNHKVKFEMKVSLRRATATGFIAVWTDDEIFGYVNDGTRPHIMGPITPKPPRRALRIPTGGSRPKTRPGKLTSSRGGAKGPFIYRKSTKAFVHPGGRARNFTDVITRRIERTNRFQKRLDLAISRGIAKSDKGVEVIK